MAKFKGIFRSRKFWAALIALLMVIVKGYSPEFPLSEEQVTNLVYVLMAYILGVGLDDGLQAARQRPALPADLDPDAYRERLERI